MSTPTQIPLPAAPPDVPSMAPLRSYLFLLTPRPGARDRTPLIHYVVEESPERAAQVCEQAHPGHRILSVRDVTDQATAA
jgi:hypothetical protein